MMDLFSRTYPRTGVHGRVVHEVGREIVSGFYKPGEKLPKEAEFMRRFRGSRTVIREAFRVLSAKGLLVARQRAGTSVRCKRYWNLLDPDILAWQSPDSINPRVARNLMEVRAFVEPLVSRLVAERASLEEINALEEICLSIEKAEMAGDSKRVFDAELKFHLTLFESCHNDLVKRMRDVVQTVLVYGHGQKALRQRLVPGTARRHFLLLEKIRQRDIIAAEFAARSVVRRTNDILEQVLPPTGGIRKAVA